MVRAVGGVLLICSAAGLAGALLGFIFGIPRPISAPQAPPAAAGGAAPPPGVDHRQAAKAWELSTNLTQISDWLTKIVVGVSLVEAKNVLAEFQTISVTAADWLFGMRHGSPALIAAVIVGGAVFGFLFAYLYTELIISRLIAAVASGLDTTAEAHAHPAADAADPRPGAANFARRGRSANLGSAEIGGSASRAAISSDPVRRFGRPPG